MAYDSARAASADKHKLLGNGHFAHQRYSSAIKEYTTAILDRHEDMELDCRKALELDKTSARAHYLLGKALIYQGKLGAKAIQALEKAYRFAVDQQQPYAKDVLQTLRTARREQWERDQRERNATDVTLLGYMRQLIENERQRAHRILTEAGLKNNDDRREAAAAINDEHDQRLAQLEHVFEQANENARKRDVPDYFCDKISFSLMHDPVITPSGITYERTELQDHIKHIGDFDPLSRQPMKEKDLVPNLALREAIEDYLQKQERLGH
ncbi:U-box domain-containing protein [Thamnocephalis sphaerospora]|uniref:E3 ubiquitin-protein ligase CHIP n=1 Tax=Thamnocephalis sphaerospora TaxID=78915 RepID=A0A4V1IXH9_9FUNG|nr:U-box domain-containing protein [Thamnocephalis sphaerospora]|eukprot:RKP11119.1 U-box domain-containing protein [Thamnocephalis sphaerospora]